MYYYKKCFLIIILYLCVLFISHAQYKPRIAVIPLNYLEVSKSEAITLTGLLETGLVNTGVFNVIEQTRIDEILAAQEYSLSDCTDVECAVRIGKLLAAEQIILGTVSRIGSKYIINAKIIDVQTGSNIKADTVEALTIDGLTEEVNLLAFKLAGLTYISGGEEEIATAFIAQYNNELERLEGIISSGASINNKDINDADSLINDTIKLDYISRDFKDRAEVVYNNLLDIKNVQDLTIERDNLIADLTQNQRIKRDLIIGGSISLSLGIGSLAGFGVTLKLGNDAYDDYNNAIYTDDAIAFREDYETYKNISIATGIAGGVLSITGILLLTLPPYPSRIQQSIDDINSQLENLRGGIR